MFRANLKEYTRDILPFLFSFIMPVFFIVAYGMSKNEQDVDKAFTANVAIVGTSAGANVVENRLKEISLFNTTRLDGDESVNTLISSGKFQVVVSVSDNSPPMVASSSEYLNLTTLIKTTLQHDSAIKNSRPDIATRIVSNNRHTGLDYSFAAILCLSLLQVALFGTASPVVMAKEKGLYRLYQVIPVPRLSLLSSQIAVRFLISVLQLLILTSIAVFIFKVPVKHPILFIGVVCSAALTLVSYGYAIAGFFSRMSVASAFLIVLNFYCIFFGQMFSDINGSPWEVLVFTTPVGFISEALHYVTTGYSSMFTIAESMTGIFVYLVLSGLIGIRLFNFEPKKN
nr:ABC transporter permease [Pantoea multigeneris]